ncbi:conserved membrane hypothetical protein [Gammaproteobacteria bacterium]
MAASPLIAVSQEAVVTATIEMLPTISLSEKIALACEAFALWFLLGASLGLGAWEHCSQSLGFNLNSFIHNNEIPPARRFGLVFIMMVGGLFATSIGALAYWIAEGGNLLKMKRAALRLAPLSCAGFLPLILNWSYWPNRELVALSLISICGIIVEFSTRRSLAVGPAILTEDMRDSFERLRRKFSKRYLVNIITYGSVLAGIVGYAVVFSIFTVRNHYRLATSDFDLAIENNLIWNAIHWGPLFKSSPLGGPDAVHTGFHQTFFAYVIGIPYRFYPQPQFLLVFQSIVIAFAAAPLFVWAKGKVGPWLATILALAYLFYPPVHGANLYDFHYQPLGHFFVWCALIFFERGKFGWAAFLTLIAFSLREDMPLMMTVIAAYLLFSRQRSIAGLILGLVSMTVFVVQKGIIMPQFLGGEESYIVQYVQMVAPGEHGFSSVIKTLITNPGFTLEKLLEGDKGIFALLVFIPLRSPMGFLFSLPVFFFNFLSTAYWPLTQISFQYTAYASMFVFLSIGHTWWKTSDPILRRSMAAGLCVAMVGATAIFGGLFQQNTARGAWELEHFTLTENDRQRHNDFYALLEQIPPLAPVAGATQLAPHLSSRPNCYTLRNFVENTEYIVYEADRLGEKEKDIILKYIERDAFGLLDQRNSFYLLKRGHDPSRNDEVFDSIR